MNNRHRTTALNVVIGLVAAGGVFSFVAGFAPGIVLVALAAIMAMTQQSDMARSIRTPDTSRRAHRLHMAALNVGIFAVCLIGYIIVTWDGEASSLGLLGTSLPGTFALVGAIGFLVAGILTPRDSSNPAH